jgi:hypothetical protein
MSKTFHKIIEKKKLFKIQLKYFFNIQLIDKKSNIEVFIAFLGVSQHGEPKNAITDI